MQGLEISLNFPKCSVQPNFPYPENKANIYRSDILPHSEITELFLSVWQHNKMTEANRQRVNFALLSYQQLNESDYRLINRLLHAIKRGWIKMTD